VEKMQLPVFVFCAENNCLPELSEKFFTGLLTEYTINEYEKNTERITGKEYEWL
jgi:hypothetical protein